MNIGITGHQKLDDPSSWVWVEKQLDEIVKGYGSDLVGFSSLAVGADQLFAEVVLNNGGKLHVVLPFEHYEQKIPIGEARNRYMSILNSAATIETLRIDGSDEEAYLAAGKRIVDLTSVMVAVWNGKKAAGLGGTGDIVEFSKSLAKPVMHINPNSFEVQEIL